MPIVTHAETTDKDGHVLTTLWKSFSEASAKDRPQDELKILEQIKSEAASRKLAWDWYDAARSYVDVKSSVNWKERRAQQAALDEEVRNVGIPVVFLTHFAGSQADWEWLEDNKAALEKSCNRIFAKNNLSGEKFSEALPELVANDYEYGVWLLNSRLGDEEGILEKTFGSSYPMGALVEFAGIEGEDEETRPLFEKYQKKYDGKAVSLLATDELIAMDFHKLQEEKGTSSQYLELRKRCESFEKMKSSFRGEEKAIASCCNEAKEVLEQMNSEAVNVTVRDGIATVAFRNQKAAHLKISKSGQKSTISSLDVKNSGSSYYVYDTVKVDLPLLDDGEYQIECLYANEKSYCWWPKHSISLAIQGDSEGLSAYAADYKTGKPLGKCELVLQIEGKEAARAQIDTRGGFCRIPQSLVSKMKPTDWKNQFHVESRDSEGRLLLSQDLSVGKTSGSTRIEEEVSRQYATILLDRAAFNPDETLNFKAILYSGRYEYRLAPTGTKYTVVLYNSKGEEVETKSFKTNEFGSIAGSFLLKDDSQGGTYSITVKKGSDAIASEYFRVDTFELPSYELVRETDDRLYLPGETAVFKGTLKSYSGHALTSARMTYSVRGVDDNAEKTCEIGPDGSFSFEFRIPEDKTYGVGPVYIKVVDGTGETKDYNFSVNSGSFRDFRAWAVDVPGEVSGLSRNTAIVNTEVLKVKYSAQLHPSLTVSYKLQKGGRTIREGVAFKPGAAGKQGEFDIDMTGLPNEVYELVVKGTMTSDSGKEYTQESRTTFVRLPDEAESFGVENAVIFKRLEIEGSIGLQLVSTVGETWAVAEVFGDGNRLLKSELVHLDGKGADSVRKIVYSRESDWPEQLTMRVFFFRNSECYDYSFDKTVPVEKYKLPLSFTRFFDTTAPRGAYSILASSAPGVECAATIFDISTEAIRANKWHEIYCPTRPTSSHSFSRTAGSNGESDSYDDIVFVGYGGRPRKMMSKVALNSVAMMCEEASFDCAEAAEVESAPFAVETAATVRENFAKTVAWEPFLRSGNDGQLELSFTNADKLSTFAVQLFAHDKSMNTATVRREMVVTIPVKLSISQPQVLREGDRYVARVTLTNGLTETSKGVITLRLFNGGDWKTAAEVASKAYRTTVPASQSITVDCPIEIPSMGLETLGILATYTPESGEDGSDAMFVTVPVISGVQTIKEAHSAVLLSGDDRAALEKKLRALFENVPGSEAAVREISIRAMLAEAVPQKIDADAENAVDVAESLYADFLATKLGASALTPTERTLLAAQLSKCRNTDGGFAWFSDMTSSMTVTALLLQRNSAMGGTLLHNDAEAAVRFLDGMYFSEKSRPIWCGGLSLAQYLYVRSLYADVPFETKNVKAETLKEFRKYVKEYLVPTKTRGLEGAVYAKTRRLLTLKNLLSGGELASKMAGITSRRLARSASDDAESLLQYAVKHDCGGWYYPNLVMPFRGLLESEASAHAMMCSLLDGLDNARAAEISEGIRLWIMLQKETQQWTSDPGYLEALDAVFHGTEATLETKVIALEATTTQPFESIKASGNGFTVERKWFIGERELKEGETLHVGDRVRAEYRIWNKENRSFVKLTAPRPASMRPVNQLSGRYGWWMSPLRVAGWYSFSPQGYRSVRPGKTEYWFDSYPEENTTVTEEFYVSQEGEFRCPVVTIESLYAPHYRANDRGESMIKSLYL